MKILIMLLCLFTFHAHGAGIGSIGLSGISGLESSATNSAGKSYFEGTGTLGYNVGVEVPLLRNFFSVGANFIYGRMEGKSQYRDYKTNLQVNDQLSQLSNSNLFCGAKIRPLNFKHLKIFTGAGVYVGNTKLRHDTDDYIEKHGALPSSFKEIEKGKSAGHYYEAGAEIIFSKSSGLRLTGQLLNNHSDRFQTLNNKPINGTYGIYSIQYIHYSDRVLPGLSRK